MTTPTELGERALRKLHVLAANEAASPEDLSLAVQAVTDAHGVLKTQALLEWTLQDIPQEVELGYVLMSAYLMADDFAQVKDPAWMAQGLAVVQSHVYQPVTETTEFVDF